MKTTSYFQLNRFLSLLRLTAVLNGRLFLITIGAFSIGLGLIFLMTCSDSSLKDWDYHTGIFVGGFITLGVLITSMSYRELLHPGKRFVYLTLPVSNLERLISMLLLTTVGFTLFFLLYYTVLSQLMNMSADVMESIYASENFPARAFASFRWSDPAVWDTIKLYTVLQGIFLIGAASFRKYPLPITLLSIAAWSLVLILVVFLTAWLVLPEYFPGTPHINMPSDSYYLKDISWDNFISVVKFLFWYVLAPFCWVLTYLKLKEKEA